MGGTFIVYRFAFGGRGVAVTIKRTWVDQFGALDCVFPSRSMSHARPMRSRLARY
jgi:hypothetical protein